MFLARGRKAVCNTLFKEIIRTLQDSDYEYGRDETRTKWKLLRLATKILADSPLALKQAHSAEIRDLVLGLCNDAMGNREQQTAKEFLSLCTDCELKHSSLSMKIQELIFLVGNRRLYSCIERAHKQSHLRCIFAGGRQADSLWVMGQHVTDLGLRDREPSWQAV